MFNKNLYILVVSGLLLFYCKQDTRGKYIKELNNETLVTTAYEQLLELYIDGQLQSLTNGDNWNLPDYTLLQPTNRLIAMEVANLADPQCGGVLASVYDGSLLTDNKWKCWPFADENWADLGFDDSSWPNAVEYGSNGNHINCNQQQFIGNISSNSKWIWTSDLNYFVAYCRGYLPFCENSSPCLNSGTCLLNDVNFCQCSPQFTGAFCETDMTTGMTTSEETTHSQTMESIKTSNLQSTDPQATEVTTFPQTTQEILTTLEATDITMGMTTSEEAAHFQTTESITTSNLQATEVTTFPQTTQEILTTLEATDMTMGMTTFEETTHSETTESITTSNLQATEVTTFPQTTQELMNGVLVITAYQDMQLMYIDGIEQPLINGNMWNQTDRAGLTETNRLVAVKVLGDETCGGILASVGDTYFLTTAEWKCSPYNFGNWYILGFDDSQEYWFNAVEFGSNADGHTHCSHLQYIPDISANAMWIWVPDQTEKTIYCRGYMPVCDSSPCLNNGTCLQNNVKICSCLPQFTGTYCETDQTQRGFGQNNSRK